MNIRQHALRWLAARNVKEGHCVTSKLYAPGESWTKSKAWWVRVPMSAVREKKTINIICERAPGSKSFRHLQVPTSFFQQHLEGFKTIGEDSINLFLSADDGSEFIDQRGPDRISFKRFEQR